MILIAVFILSIVNVILGVIALFQRQKQIRLKEQGLDLRKKR